MGLNIAKVRIGVTSRRQNALPCPSFRGQKLSRRVASICVVSAISARLAPQRSRNQGQLYGRSNLHSQRNPALILNIPNESHDARDHALAGVSILSPESNGAPRLGINSKLYCAYLTHAFEKHRVRRQILILAHPEQSFPRKGGSAIGRARERGGRKSITATRAR